MNRTDRLVAMVMYMQGRRLVRAEDLAEHFEISVRTVYRDLAALAESGVPLVGESGVGYSLLKSYHLPPVMLTAEEASALFLGAELAHQFTDGSLQPAIKAALLKLRAVLPRDRQEYVEQLSRKTLVVGPSCAASAQTSDRQWLLTLQEAAVKSRVVRLQYRGRGRETETAREVEPLGVVFYGATWYLIAWCRLRGALRHFRLDRMIDVELLDEAFDARPEFSLAQHLRNSAGSEEMIPVRIWFSRRVLDRARRESFVAITEQRERGQGVEIAMGTFSLPALAAWLLSFGNEAEALEPETLREHVRDAARSALERHGGNVLAEPQFA